MKNKFLLIYILFLYLPFFDFGQDIHWSQFNDNPLFQNPSSAGQFDGDFRFIGNYRDQWRSVTVPFSTLSFSADGRLTKHKSIGYGLLMFHDMTGDGQLRTIELQGTVSVGMKLMADSSHLLRLGVNAGMNHRQVNWDKFYFDNQYNGMIFDPSLPTNESYLTDRKTNGSIGLGALYEWLITDRNKWSVGYSAFNLNRPNQGFYTTVVPRDIRHCVFIKGSYPLGFDWDMLPAVQFSAQGTYQEWIMGSSFRYTLQKKGAVYRAFYAGAWYRNLDAACLSLGLDYQQLFVGVSYDINFSKLVPASRNRGAFEIAVRYILHHFKPQNIQHRVCPDYI